MATFDVNPSTTIIKKNGDTYIPRYEKGRKVSITPTGGVSITYTTPSAPEQPEGVQTSLEVGKDGYTKTPQQIYAEEQLRRTAEITAAAIRKEQERRTAAGIVSTPEYATVVQRDITALEFQTRFGGQEVKVGEKVFVPRAGYGTATTGEAFGYHIEATGEYYPTIYALQKQTPQVETPSMFGGVSVEPTTTEEKLIASKSYQQFMKYTEPIRLTAGGIAGLFEYPLKIVYEPALEFGRKGQYISTPYKMYRGGLMYGKIALLESTPITAIPTTEIGRASCRERV